MGCDNAHHGIYLANRQTEITALVNSISSMGMGVWKSTSSVSSMKNMELVQDIDFDRVLMHPAVAKVCISSTSRCCTLRA